ncbi:RNA polymerase sigma factor (sigma-70 family) [Arthrobacter sp. 1088]|uniref:RNA polymerase sigma factor n=1 Tax=Arthrobacter sp. 1088 TaxID=2817768 RepID=UPI0028677FBB|nr:sigma-70 family RNA polymerase sigma factor [Arthrobacter sp. 1088]MDR6688990.1 RNA polymerase sigma factor (sigma-70 family) [Arthrobacter sp. 1088]
MLDDDSPAGGGSPGYDRTVVVTDGGETEEGFLGVPTVPEVLFGPVGPDLPAGEEAAVLARVRAGDTEAMAVLYGRHRERALGYARRLTSGVQEAEDVLHEAFVKSVVAIRKGYGPTDVFGPYLSTSIRNTVMTMGKKAGRERPTPDEYLDTSREDPYLENALFVTEHERVTAAMRSLPERWRTVLWHTEVLGKKPREIAPVMGIEPNAVSALLVRARAGLRAAYTKLQDEHTHPRTGRGRGVVNESN